MVLDLYHGGERE